MCEFAASDPGVWEYDATEHIAHANEDFADMAGSVETRAEKADPDIGENPTWGHTKLQKDNAPDKSWVGKIIRNPKTGEPETTLTNCMLLMKNLPQLRGALAENELLGRPVIQKPVPWHPVVANTLDGDNWVDADLVKLKEFLSRTWKMSNGNQVEDALKVELEDNKFNPIFNRLKSLEGTWDGVPRIDTMLIDWLGAEDTPYIRAVTRKWMAAAVARIYNPGLKFDCMLVVVGPQGIGKSTLAQKLSRGRFTDSLSDLHGKEAMEQLRGAWIVELAELAATKRSETETIKNFISKTEDAYRPAYDHYVRYFPRMCVFYGTTNDIEFLKDRTGNRRFWPVMCHGKDQGQLKGFDDVVDQFWAEAIEIYKTGEKLWLDEPDIRALAAREQDRFTVQDELAGMIEEYLDQMLPQNWSEYTPGDRRDFIAGNKVVDETACTLRRKEPNNIHNIWPHLRGHVVTFSSRTRWLTGVNQKHGPGMISLVN